MDKKPIVIRSQQFDARMILELTKGFKKAFEVDGRLDGFECDDECIEFWHFIVPYENENGEQQEVSIPVIRHAAYDDMSNKFQLVVQVPYNMYDDIGAKLRPIMQDPYEVPEWLYPGLMNAFAEDLFYTGCITENGANSIVFLPDNYSMADGVIVAIKRIAEWARGARGCLDDRPIGLSKTIDYSDVDMMRLGAWEKRAAALYVTNSNQEPSE